MKSSEVIGCEHCGKTSTADGDPRQECWFCGRVLKVPRSILWERMTQLESDLAAAQAENERLHSWDGLIELLNEHWPADIFNGSSGDPGPTIVALIRVIDTQRTEIERLRTALERIVSVPTKWPLNVEQDIARAALEGSD